MPLRKPRKDESEDDWMAYCMHELSTPEATKRPQEQKVAICMNAWRDRNKSSTLAEMLARAADYVARGGFDPGAARDGLGKWARGHRFCPKCGYHWTVSIERPKE